MKSEKFLLDIQTKCVDIANKILNLATDTEQTLKCKWPNGQTYLRNKEVEPVEPVQMYMYQSNTYRKDLSWLHFNNEPKVQEWQQVKDQQSYISVFVVIQQFQVETRSTSPGAATVFHAWPYCRFIEIESNLRRKKLHRTNQSSMQQFQQQRKCKGPNPIQKRKLIQHLKI